MMALASTAPFAVAVLSTLGKSFLKAVIHPRSADLGAQLQKVADTIRIALSQYSAPMDPYTLDVLEVR